MKQALRKPRIWLTALVLLLGLVFVPPFLGYALIGYAANGQVSAVDHLLALGVYPSDDAVGAAAYNGRTAVVRSLLRAGANPNAQNDMAETALTYASEYGHTDVVKLLLAAGADPNWGCREKDPLTVAREGHYGEIVRLLKKAGARE